MESILNLYGKGSQYAPQKKDKQSLRMPAVDKNNSYHSEELDGTSEEGYSLDGTPVPKDRITIPGRGGEATVKLPAPTRLSTSKSNNQNSNFFQAIRGTQKNLYKDKT